MSLGRLFFIVVGIILLVGTGTAWILSTQGVVIQNSWSIPLGTGFGVLGSLFGFCQWAISLPPSDSKTSTDSATLEAQESFVKQVYDRLSQGNGALVIYEKMSRVGSNVQLRDEYWRNHSKANVVERMANGRSLVTAIFPDLKPGRYVVYGHSEFTEVTKLPKQVAEVDWRGQGKKVRDRQYLFANLRAASGLAVIGGLLFLAHRYLMIPYLDIVGLILIGLGVFGSIGALFG